MSYVGSRKHPRTASVTAVDAVTAVEVKPDALAHATETCVHAFDVAFLELLVSRLEAANIRLSSLLLDRRVSIF
jgi:CRP-like cAMP-binding protein